MDRFRIDLMASGVVSIHDQLVAHISEQIVTRAVAPGEQLPSETVLARELGISRMTVRGAFDTLVRAGMVVRRQGKGTFVATETSGLLAFVGQTLTSGISSELVAQLNLTLAQRRLSGWHLLVCGAQNDLERQLEYSVSLRRHGVRGIILAPAVVAHYERNAETLLALQRARVPFVLLERHVEQVDCDYVVSDDFRAGFLATDHLVRLGHQRVALLDGVPMPSIRQRASGYRAALAEHGLEADPDLACLWPDHTVDLDGTRIAALVDRGATAVFCYADNGAVQVIRWCASHGLRVPDDLAVVGVGDLRVVRGEPRPVLTTVRLNFAAMADLALEILLGRIDGTLDRGAYRHEVVDVELVVRESCGAAKPAGQSLRMDAPAAGCMLTEAVPLR